MTLGPLAVKLPGLNLAGTWPITKELLDEVAVSLPHTSHLHLDPESISGSGWMRLTTLTSVFEIDLNGSSEVSLPMMSGIVVFAATAPHPGLTLRVILKFSNAADLAAWTDFADRLAERRSILGLPPLKFIHKVSVVP